jgi:hypothetical protein
MAKKVKVRRKKVVTTAERFDPAVKPWPANVWEGSATTSPYAGNAPGCYYVNRGFMKLLVCPGDWIVTTGDAVDVYSNDAFERAFEEDTDAQA